MGECVSLYPRSEPICREDIDNVSGWTREASVRMDELLDFFESARRSRKKEVLDVVDQTLAVSLVSLEVDRRPDALLNRLVTPSAAEVFELMDTGQASTWKFELVREVATTRKGKLSYRVGRKKNIRRSGVVPAVFGRGWEAATGTTGASTGTAALLANLSNRFCRRMRYSSSLFSKFSTRSREKK